MAAASATAYAFAELSCNSLAAFGEFTKEGAAVASVIQSMDTPMMINGRKETRGGKNHAAINDVVL